MRGDGWRWARFSWCFWSRKQAARPPASIRTPRLTGRCGDEEFGRVVPPGPKQSPNRSPHGRRVRYGTRTIFPLLFSGPAEPAPTNTRTDCCNLKNFNGGSSETRRNFNSTVVAESVAQVQLEKSTCNLATLKLNICAACWKKSVKTVEQRVEIVTSSEFQLHPAINACKSRAGFIFVQKTSNVLKSSEQPPRQNQNLFTIDY